MRSLFYIFIGLILGLGTSVVFAEVQISTPIVQVVDKPVDTQAVQVLDVKSSDFQSLLPNARQTFKNANIFLNEISQ